MDISSFLKKLYINSLTPFELLELSKEYKCNFEKKEEPSYLDIWKKCLSNEGAEEPFNKYLEFNGLNDSDLSLMTSNLTTEEAIDLPYWTKTLEEVFSHINLKPKPNKKSQEKPFYKLLAPFIDFFYSKLTQHIEIQNIKMPSNKVIEQLKLALHKDLINLAHFVFFDEFFEFKKEKGNLTKSFENENDDLYFQNFVMGILSDKFQALFFKYPMLARNLATRVHYYTKFIIGVFEKLEKDKHEIEYIFNRKITKIKKLHINSGDLHNDESTLIIEFENSNKIVYKPVSSAITGVYNEFLNWINVNLGCELKSFKVIDKGSYSWLEYVENEECDSIEDVKMYYQRSGILSGIAYFLNARDYHYENLIAAGNSPVLIDHETIVNPIIKKLNKKNTAGNVLKSLLLPNIDEGKPPYVYGFGSSVQMEEIGLVPKIKNTNKDSMERVMETTSLKLYKSNKPKLNGHVQNLADYEAEFIKGFECLYNLILDKKIFLISKNSPLKGFEDLTIRFINRPTGVYFKLLRLLNKPQYLKDPIKYGIKIELLARAYSIRGNWSPILNSERKQVLSGNIPAFYTNTLSTNLIASNGQIADEFEFTAMGVINYKIERANSNDYQSQLDLIQEVISL